MHLVHANEPDSAAGSGGAGDAGDHGEHEDHHDGGDGDGGAHGRPDDPDLPIHHKDGGADNAAQNGDVEHHETDADYDHDVVTGSEQQAEEFKDLSPEESKKRLSVLAKRMDVDKDGFVNQEELKKWLLNSFVSLDNERSAKEMKAVDKNNDHRVTFEEYMVHHYGHNQTELDKMRKDKPKDMEQFLQSIEMDLKKFKLADRDNNGQLNVEEYTAFAHPQNYVWMAPFELIRTLQDFDHNKDNKISFDEFLGSGKMTEENRKHEKKTFDLHDHDKNGFLEGKEITEWAMPGFDKAATDEVKHLFKETDENKDSKLSMKEIVDQSEMWVGSQATNYGSHLDRMKKDEL